MLSAAFVIFGRPPLPSLFSSLLPLFSTLNEGQQWLALSAEPGEERGGGGEKVTGYTMDGHTAFTRKGLGGHLK